MIKYSESRMNHCDKCNSGLCSTQIKNLSVRYGKEEILKNINLHIHCGELVAIIGENGAGKSTLLKAIIGENSYSGNLYFTDGEKKLSRKPVIGYVPQKLDFDYSSPVSVLDFFSAISSERPVYLKPKKDIRKKCIESLRRVDAEKLVDKKLGVLSGGELQRVLLALALEPIPDILLLDEPVSGIDRNGLKMFYNIVSDMRRDYDLSIILVSHDLNLVSRHADCVVFLDNKTVGCAGPPKEVFKNKKVVDTFGLDWNPFIDNKRNGVEDGVNLV